MKTFTLLKSKSMKISLTLAAVILLAGNASLFSQEFRSAFDADTNTKFVWGIEVKTSGIQNEYGTQYGMYAGAELSQSFMVGMVGALNVTHPAVNYGYMGLMVKYIYKPTSVVHMSCQFTLGAGSTRDYENEKSSTFDNLGNVYGTGFYFIEPVINSEINVGRKTTLIFGLGYRLVNGINSSSHYISTTHVSDKDLSSVTVSAGIQFDL
jgi:hypothetical protein